MTPYYESGGIAIYHADCREILHALPVPDCVITDPPYGATKYDWDTPVEDWAPSLKGNSLWSFGNLRFFLEHPFSGWTYAQEIIWRKHNGSNFHNDRFRRVHELIVHFYRGPWAAVWKEPVYRRDAKARRVRRRRRPPHMGDIGESSYASDDGGRRLELSVIDVPSCHGRAEHPTQKPEGIIGPLIHYSVRPGGLVLDPFAGSGATLLAAREMGRYAIGIEIEEKYCELAARRLSQGIMF